LQPARCPEGCPVATLKSFGVLTAVSWYIDIDSGFEADVRSGEIKFLHANSLLSS